MIVRCGRCRIELEVAGPGEFACPNCGARNVVRGGADPLAGVPDLGAPGASTAGSGLIGGSPTPPPPSDEPPPGVGWIVCPACSYRFAVGDVDQVSCPTCSAALAVSDGAASLADSP